MGNKSLRLPLCLWGGFCLGPLLWSPVFGLQLRETYANRKGDQVGGQAAAILVGDLDLF